LYLGNGKQKNSVKESNEGENEVVGGEKGERGVEVREKGMEGERNENENESEGEGRNINKDEMDNTQNNNNIKSRTIPSSNTHSIKLTEKSSVKNGNTNVNSSADSGSCIPESEDFVVPPIGRIQNL
jgi:hypothetical protein